MSCVTISNNNNIILALIYLHILIIQTLIIRISDKEQVSVWQCIFTQPLYCPHCLLTVWQISFTNWYGALFVHPCCKIFKNILKQVRSMFSTVKKHISWLMFRDSAHTFTVEVDFWFVQHSDKKFPFSLSTEFVLVEGYITCRRIIYTFLLSTMYFLHLL